MEFKDRLSKELHIANLTDDDIDIAIHWEKSIPIDGKVGIYISKVSVRGVESMQKFYWDLDVERYLLEIEDDKPTIARALLHWWKEFSENLFIPLCFDETA